MALGYDGSIRIDTKVNSKGVNTGISQMLSNVNTGVNKMIASFGRLAAAVGVAFGVAAIVNFGRESVKAASQLSSALIGLQSIVEGQGRSFQQAQGFIQDYIKDGLIPMQDAVTAYKNLAMRGYGTEQIESTMLALKDSATFGRQASLTMGEAVASATEGLKNENSILVDNAGVTKNVSVMWKEYAEQLGVGVQSLTKQQRIQAEVNGIMKETRFQTGDAAKAVNTYAGQMSMLSFRFQQLKVAVGEAIIPIVQAALPSVNTLIAAMTNLANIAAQVTTALFGSTLVKDQTESEEDLAEAGKDAADANGDLAGATGDVGDAVQEASKKVKGSLAPFDDLKKLAGDAASSMEDAAGGLDFPSVGEGVLFGQVTVSPEILNFIKTLQDELAVLGSALSRLWETFKKAWDKYGAPVIDAVKRAFSSIWDMLKAIGETFLRIWEQSGAEKILGGLLEILAGIFNFIATLAEQFKIVWNEMGDGLVEAFFFAVSSVIELIQSIGVAFAEAWNSGLGEQILSTILSILTNIFNYIGEIASRLKEAWEANNNGVEIWKSILNIILMVLGFINDIFYAASNWAKNIDYTNLITSFKELLQAIEPLVEIILDGLLWAYENVLLPFSTWYVEDAAPAAIDLFSEAIKLLTEVVKALQPYGLWLWENFLEPLREFAWDLIIVAIETITEALRGLSGWMQENEEAVQLIITALTTFFAIFAASTIIKTIDAVVDSLFMAASAMGAVNFATLASNAALLTLIGAIVMVVSAFDKMTAFEKVISILSIGVAVIAAAAIAFGALSSAMTLGVAAVAIVAGIAAITTAINAATRDTQRINMSFGTGSFSGGRSAQSMGGYSLPHLANGAVIPPNREFMAVLGDQRSGTNIEAPLATIEQAVINAMQKGGGGADKIALDVHVDLDGREIWRNQQVVSRQMGSSLARGVNQG